MTKTTRTAAAVLLLSLAYGACFLFDAQPAKQTSWHRYFGLALLGGGVLFAAQAAAELTNSRDRATDPIIRRLLRLAALLMLAALAFGVLWLIRRAM